MRDIDPSLDKIPPHNLEAEQSILGGMLLESSSINSVLEILCKDDFYRESHRKIFSIIIELSEKKVPIDLITLSSALKDKSILDSVGGTSYLSSLVGSDASATNIINYANIVKEKALLRGLYATALDIMNSCLEAGSDIDEVLNQAGHSINQISQNKLRPSFYPVRDIVNDGFKAIEKIYTSYELITGVATGFDQFDDLTAGLQKSDLIIIAAQSSRVMTAFALNIAPYISMEYKIPVAFFSLEMSKEQIAFHLLASEAKVDLQRIYKGHIGQTDWPKLTAAAKRLSEGPLFIDDTAAITIHELEAKSRRLAAESGLGLIIVDHIQLMRTVGYGDNREKEILEISRSLKALAKELCIPIVAFAMLNQKAKEPTRSRPQILDLRESGVIEQYADTIAFINCDEVYDESDFYPERGTAEIIIAKQRSGPPGTFNLGFNRKFMLFGNLAHNENKPPRPKQTSPPSIRRRRNKGNVAELDFKG